MDFDGNVLLNFASIVATLIISAAAGITIFYRLKLRRWPVNANCWFCNNCTKINRSELNWWRCPDCEQYNGFTKDGDYARDIPEQSEPSPKSFAKPYTPEDGKSTKSRKERDLCESCSRNQELKISELREFEPRGFFDDGSRRFKKQLEAKYRLCDDCKIFVKNVLREQSLWLTRHKMLFYRDKSVRAIVLNARRFNEIIGTSLTMLTSALVYYPNNRLLALAGASLQSTVFLVDGAHRARTPSDAILALLWISMIIFQSSEEQTSLLKLCRSDEWPSLKNLAEHHTATFLSVVIGIVSITRRRCRRNPSYVASLKKLCSAKGAVPRETFSSSNDRESSFEVKSAAHPSRYCQDRWIASPPETLQREDKPSEEERLSNGDADNRRLLKFNRNFQRYSFDDSLSTLKTLTLGGGGEGGDHEDNDDGEKRRSTGGIKVGKIPSIFERKVYGPSSGPTSDPDLFSRTYKSSSKLILAPAKFKSFAQTSWVAGGYWQVGVDSPSLSRSSSQSSGFGSAGSNFGPSREASLAKEMDRCSVISEKGQKSQGLFVSRYPSRASSLDFPRSINSRCRHGGAPRIHIARFDERSLLDSQSHLSPVHPYRIESNAPREPHSPPIEPSLPSPGYSNAQNNTLCLMILLGGSLVINMAVFLTIILR